MPDHILRFWGKARPAAERPGPAWHPLVYHSLDVAAVGHVLLKRHNGLSQFYRLLGLDREAVDQVLCFLLALHDLGKFSIPFQAKAPQLTPFAEPPSTPDPGHSRASALVWYDRSLEPTITPLFADLSGIDPLAMAVFGHHGKPVTDVQSVGMAALFGQMGCHATTAFVQVMADLFLPGARAIDIQPRSATRASFPLAGLAVLCDWIGSNQTWFPYREPGPSPFDYWPLALDQAERAIREAGVLPARVRPATGYESLTGLQHFVPRPMQLWAKDVALPDGPTLVLIEDDTGSGKTETALMLAHRLMAAGRASGLYVALPTMATADAMFDRLKEAYRNLFASDEMPSLALAHGARDLHPGFRRAGIPAGSSEPGYGGVVGSSHADDVTATTACADWIADDRRRSFLADVGAGTVDQALLAILPSKFQSLRLFGLCQRVLVLDEIHAYDAYVQQEIVTLLRFQAALGGSVVLLSATLPEDLRRRFIRAFRQGLGVNNNDDETQSVTRPYPLAACITASGQTEAAVEASRHRSVPVRRLDTPELALAEVARAAGEGCAVAYIRNTVDDAIDATRDLAARGFDPMLFHARFALVDRLAREQDVLETFGKYNTASKRAGRILVATQVVEQSLDLDFDLIVSDLAPIDLLIQRAGRLWRHQRERPPGPCELLVVSPAPIDEADERWYARDFPRAAFVYRNHAQLWLTAKTLEERGTITSPDGLRPLLEAVYGEDADERAPESLMRSWIEAVGRAGADRGVAQQNTLKLEEGYTVGSGAWDADVRTPTRLGEEETVTLRLARLEDSRIRPWAAEFVGPEDEPWRAWRLSECRVRRSLATGEISWPASLAAQVAAAKADWSRFDEAKVLVVLAFEDGQWRGFVQSRSGERALTYDPFFGLTAAE